jgi:hypothetical protein
MSLQSRRGGEKLRTMAIALDTLAYAKRLREAGFTEQQAEGQAQALAAAMTDSLATKQDLHELEARVDARFDSVEARVNARFDAVDGKFAAIDARFDARLADLERRMTMRLGGMMVAGIGVVSVLVKLI